jgi:putative flippase GtrA
MIFQDTFKKLLDIKFLRFIIVGGFATLTHYIFYLLFLNIIDKNLAFFFGFAISFILNYFLSATFTFKKAKKVNNFIGFIIGHLFNFFIQLLLLNVFANFLSVDKLIAPIFVFVVAFPINYLVIRFVFNLDNI